MQPSLCFCSAPLELDNSFVVSVVLFRCFLHSRRWIERRRKLPSLRCLYTTVMLCNASSSSIVIDTVDGVAHSNGNVLNNILVDPLSTLLSGSSRLLSSDGRANHRTHTPKRLEQQQLDRFHYETTAGVIKPTSRFQEWTARLQAAVEHITRMNLPCFRMESRSA